VVNDRVVGALGISDDPLDIVAAHEGEELARREQAYRGGRPAPEVRDRIVILVDDGLATGSTMQAAVQALRPQRPARIVVAVPTAPRETCDELRRGADAVVCLATPDPFLAVGDSYADFSEISDEEVRDLLARSAGSPATS
jgi:putative phosphoribosyl transferase